jgi:hypothetical protein
MIDVAAAIDEEAVNVTLTRVADGAYDQTPGSADFGEWVPGAPSTSTIRAAIQPASGRQREDLPEGIRNKAQWLMWSRTELRGNDRVVWADRTFEVVHVWPRHDGAFWKAALGEVS